MSCEWKPYERIALLLVSSLVPASLPAVAQNVSIGDYGAECKRLIGDVPSFSCLDGTVIPVTNNGTPLTSPGPECDLPIMLHHGKQNGAECVPGSTVIRPPVSDPDVDLVFVCRKYHNDDASYEFQDIAGIHYNRRTGATCWYQSPPGLPLDGRVVPSPTEAKQSGKPDPAAFWLSATHAEGHGCLGCHENDPFMHSPWVDQVQDANRVPNVADGFAAPRPYTHVSVNGAFNWPPVHRMQPPDPVQGACTSCHRLGSSQPTFKSNSGGNWVNLASGRDIQTGHATAQSWMPYPNAQMSPYTSAVDHILQCYRDDENDIHYADCGWTSAEPELSVGRVDFTWRNGNVDGEFTVHNDGDTSAEKIEVKLQLPSGSQTMRLDVDPKQTSVQSFTVPGATAALGGHSVTVQVDTARGQDGEFDEGDENNNQKTAAVPGLPDLSPTLGAGQLHGHVTAWVTVKNLANHAGVEDIDLDFELTVPGLPSYPKQRKRTKVWPNLHGVASFEVSLPDAAHLKMARLRVWVDPANTIHENNENNNYAETSLLILIPIVHEYEPGDWRLRERARHGLADAILERLCQRIQTVQGSELCGGRFVLPDMFEPPTPWPPIPETLAVYDLLAPLYETADPDLYFETMFGLETSLMGGQPEDLPATLLLAQAVMDEVSETFPGIPLERGMPTYGEAMPDWYIQIDPAESDGVFALRPELFGPDSAGTQAPVPYMRIDAPADRPNAWVVVDLYEQDIDGDVRLIGHGPEGEVDLTWYYDSWAQQLIGDLPADMWGVGVRVME